MCLPRFVLRFIDISSKQRNKCKNKAAQMKNQTTTTTKYVLQFAHSLPRMKWRTPLKRKQGTNEKKKFTSPTQLCRLHTRQDASWARKQSQVSNRHRLNRLRFKCLFLQPFFFSFVLSLQMCVEILSRQRRISCVSVLCSHLSRVEMCRKQYFTEKKKESSSR